MPDFQNRPNAPTGSYCSPAGVSRLLGPQNPRPKVAPSAKNQEELFNRTTPLPRIGIEEIISRRDTLTCRF